MKRCPKCIFPNKDTDRTCFKCNTLLDEVPSTSANVVPTDAPPTSLLSTASPAPRNSKRGQSAASEASATADAFIDNRILSEVPPLTTTPPKLKTPARITPKYKAFTILSVILKIFSPLQGIAIIVIGCLFATLMTPLSATCTIILSVILGLTTTIIGLLFAYALTWMGDVECNQRKELELLNHLYHMIQGE